MSSKLGNLSLVLPMLTWIYQRNRACWTLVDMKCLGCDDELAHLHTASKRCFQDSYKKLWTVEGTRCLTQTSQKWVFRLFTHSCLLETSAPSYIDHESHPRFEMSKVAVNFSWKDKRDVVRKKDREVWKLIALVISEKQRVGSYIEWRFIVFTDFQG